MVVVTLAGLLIGNFALLKTVFAGNARPQLILSTANVQQQALIQQLLLQNALVGCNSLLLASPRTLDVMPTQTVNCTGIPATDRDSKQVTGSQNNGYSTDEVI